MAAKVQTYVYLHVSSKVSYNKKWNVKFNIFKVNESISRSRNSVGM